MLAVRIRLMLRCVVFAVIAYDKSEKDIPERVIDSASTRDRHSVDIQRGQMWQDSSFIHDYSMTGDITRNRSITYRQAYRDSTCLILRNFGAFNKYRQFIV